MPQPHEIEDVHHSGHGSRNEPLSAGTERDRSHRQGPLIPSPRVNPVHVLLEAVHQATYPPCACRAAALLFLGYTKIDDSDIPSRCRHDKPSAVGGESQGMGRRRASARESDPSAGQRLSRRGNPGQAVQLGFLRVGHGHEIPAPFKSKERKKSGSLQITKREKENESHDVAYGFYMDFMFRKEILQLLFKTAVTWLLCV